MKIKTKLIGDDFHFDPRQPSIRCAQDALEYYKSHDIDADNWLYEKEKGLPIFLDTNVLLDLYGTSIRSRNQFLNFLQENKDRIYITGQVNKEYLRNRVSVINSAIQLFDKSKDETTRLILDVTNENRKLKNKLLDWQKKRGFEKDLPEEVRVKVEEIEKIIDTILGEDVQTKISTAQQVISDGFDNVKSKIVSEYEDIILTKITDVKSLDTLSKEELNYIRALYAILFKEAGVQKEGKEIKDYFEFPGRGDHEKSDKGLDPSGDLVIYHEMLKFMDSHNTDVIFLTGDVTKKDWIKPTGYPYSHYIIDNYYNTGHVIYIVDYQRCNFDIRPIEEEMPKEVIPSSEECLNATSSTQTEEVSVEENIEMGQADENALLLPAEESVTGDLKYTPYIKITEEQFLTELQRSIRWAQNYGNGAVSLNFFINNILAHKGFDLRTCYYIKNKLLKTGRIRIISITREGHSFDSIQLAEMDAESNVTSDNVSPKRSKDNKLLPAQPLSVKQDPK